MIPFLLTLSLIFSFAHADEARELSLEEFQALELFEYVQVLSAERVFSDPVEGEDIYWVHYFTENSVAIGEENADPSGGLALICEYILVDTTRAQQNIFEVTETGVTCDQDIEEVIGEPVLIEEN